jgi:superfamily I DNA/RNA helicase/RecB family exonuclease
MKFLPDEQQNKVLEHRTGALLVTGGPGTGKTAVLRERFARLIEDGADPERVVLVTRSRRDRAEARAALMGRLQASLPSLHILTVHGLAYQVVSRRQGQLEYEGAPRVLSWDEQSSKVQDLLRGEDPKEWPAYRGLLRLQGFAEEVRQFLLRAQEASLEPADIVARAEKAGLSGWREVAAFYDRYLQVLDSEGAVDFAGLVVQAAAAAGRGTPLFDHVLVDDYQEATFALERLLAELAPQSLVVAGDESEHVLSFQGSTDVPIRRFVAMQPGATPVDLAIDHRSTGRALEAWVAAHSSEEHAAAAREIRRIHVEEDVPWRDIAVVTRRQGNQLGVLRALDDAGVPRMAPEAGISLLAEPATAPLILALRWIAGSNAERDGLAESVLTSDLGGLSPAVARGLVRAAATDGRPPTAALEYETGLDPAETARVAELRSALDAAADVASRSVLDAFRILWTRLPFARSMVASGNGSGDGLSGGRALDSVVALADAVARAADRPDPSVPAFLESMAAEGPGAPSPIGRERPDAVSVLTAHGSAGQEFDTVLVVGAVEGGFPSLARPEPMFDLAVLEHSISQSERNRLRLEDERRLFRMVVGRARRRVLFLASVSPAGQAKLAARSRFVDELEVPWKAVPAGPFDDVITSAEAGASWRRALSDPSRSAPDRLAALDGLVALGDDPARWWFQRDWTDSGRPLHEHIRVSYSKLDKLENCSLQYVLAEELGLESRAGYHAWVGNLVHRIIEECELGEIERSLDALLAAADERWEPKRFPSLAVSQAFRRVVRDNVLPGWFKEYGESPAVGRELHFEFEFDGATVSGYIDRVSNIQSGGTQITDYKTGKSRNAGKVEENLQLGIYYLAVQEAEELAPFRPVKGVELAFLRDRGRDGLIARAYKGFTSKDHEEYREVMTERLSGLIGEIKEQLSGEVYRPSPAANCRFCEFKPLCPLWPEGADVLPLEVTP